jgi:hypothetical protein
MTGTLTDFGVLEGNRPGVTDKNLTDQRILDRYTVTDLKARDQEEARIHIQQIQ